jgi:murein DD-endopeptidase MepM/ murein hydrolase activator NlpD
MGLWVMGLSAAGILALWTFSRLTPPAGASLPRNENAEALEAAAPSLASFAGAFTRGTLLHGVLKGASIPPESAVAIVESLRAVLNPRSLTEADRYELVASTAGDFHRLSIARRLDLYVVETSSSGLVSRKERVPLTERERSASGALHDSLWVSMSEAGLDPAVIVAFAEVFAWNVDFIMEAREGDRFALTWVEKRTPDGKLAEATILGAAYDGRSAGRHTAARFRGEYYDAEGQSLRRAFLHAPLAFRRISSGFSLRRLHPILGTHRPHRGIDYAAPSGTPISAIGDGTVTFKGWKGGFGNFVEIRHNGTYTSRYGHLSRYARGVARGTHVRQGQTIGYVGMTGLATGPHLHFEMIKNGTYVNFLRLKFPSTGSVPANLREEFRACAARVLPPVENALAGVPAAPPPQS